MTFAYIVDEVCVCSACRHYDLWKHKWLISYCILFFFSPGMKKFEYKGKQWHEECFTCMICKEPIRNKSFIPRDEQVVCVPCYERDFAQKCTSCSGVSPMRTTRVGHPNFGKLQSESKLCLLLFIATMLACMCLRYVVKMVCCKSLLVIGPAKLIYCYRIFFFTRHIYFYSEKACWFTIK